MDETYHKIANKYLQDLRFEASSSGEHLLQNADQEVAKWSADESTVDSHLRDS